MYHVLVRQDEPGVWEDVFAAIDLSTAQRLAWDTVFDLEKARLATDVVVISDVYMDRFFEYVKDGKYKQTCNDIYIYSRDLK